MKKFTAKNAIKGLKRWTKYAVHKERQHTGDTHSWGLPVGASPIKRKLRYEDGYRY